MTDRVDALESEPLVSVIVPTHQRPALVVRAVRSALAQTYRHLEVVVVVDGPSPDTQNALLAIDDARLRTCVVPVNRGLGHSINTGVANAKGDFVAFLDDDDEWMPEKLSVQMSVAPASGVTWPIVSCVFIARSSGGDRLWPQRMPDAHEVMSEYLYCQRGLRGGEGMLLPSTLLMPKALLERVPYSVGLPRFNDVDWLLRVSRVEGVAVLFPDPGTPPLVVWHHDSGRATMSQSGAWQQGLAFARDRRALFTARSYASFLLTQVAAIAARERRPRAIPVLLAEATRRGAPRLMDVLAFGAIWLVPPRLRVVLTARR